MQIFILWKSRGKALLFSLNFLILHLRFIVGKVESSSDKLISEASGTNSAHEHAENEQQTVMEATDITECVPIVVASPFIHVLGCIDAEMHLVDEGIIWLGLRIVARPFIWEDEIIYIGCLLIIGVVQVIIDRKVVHLEDEVLDDVWAINMSANEI